MKVMVLNKFRFTLFVVLSIIILTFIANLLLGLNNAEGSTVIDYETVVIESGDTLWDIASKYSPNNKDIREYIYEICELNEISASTLIAGMKIMIPIYH